MNIIISDIFRDKYKKIRAEKDKNSFTRCLSLVESVSNPTEIPNVLKVENSDMFLLRVNAYYRIVFSFYENNFIAVDIIDRRRD